MENISKILIFLLLIIPWMGFSLPDVKALVSHCETTFRSNADSSSELEILYNENNLLEAPINLTYVFALGSNFGISGQIDGIDLLDAISANIFEAFYRRNYTFDHYLSELTRDQNLEVAELAKRLTRDLTKSDIRIEWGKKINWAQTAYKRKSSIISIDAIIPYLSTNPNVGKVAVLGLVMHEYAHIKYDYFRRVKFERGVSQSDFFVKNFFLKIEDEALAQFAGQSTVMKLESAINSADLDLALWITGLEFRNPILEKVKRYVSLHKEADRELIVEYGNFLRKFYGEIWTSSTHSLWQFLSSNSHLDPYEAIMTSLENSAE